MAFDFLKRFLAPKANSQAKSKLKQESQRKTQRKPSSLLRYCVIDVETPNSSNDRISAIGVVDIVDGEIISSRYWLVNPEAYFHTRNVNLTGITPESVAGEPTFPAVWFEISHYFYDGYIIVAHNASFDLSVLYKTLSSYAIPIPDFKYTCTQKLSKSLLPDLSKYSLDSLCDYYSIPLKQHHNAQCDAESAASLLLHLLKANHRIVQDSIDVYYPTFDLNDFTPQKSAFIHPCMACGSARPNLESVAFKQLLDLIDVVLEDNNVTVEEALTVKEWLNKYDGLKDKFPFNRIFSVLEIILSDNYKATDDGLDELRSLFTMLKDPVSTLAVSDMVDVTGKTVCISGDFSFGDKDAVKQRLVDSGAIVKDRPVKSLECLIVGDKNNPDWLSKSYGTKIKQVVQWIDGGARIQIVRESSVSALCNTEVIR